MRSPKLRSKHRGSRPASSAALGWSNLMGMTLIGTRSLPAALEELKRSGARERSCPEIGDHPATGSPTAPPPCGGAGPFDISPLTDDEIRHLAYRPATEIKI